MTASASRILKAAGKMRAPSESSDKRAENGKERHNGEGDELGESGEAHAHAHPEPEEDEEPLTDPDGWVYANNKWEGGSSKGGMDKVRLRLSGFQRGRTSIVADRLSARSRRDTAGGRASRSSRRRSRSSGPGSSASSATSPCSRLWTCTILNRPLLLRSRCPLLCRSRTPRRRV